MKTFYLFLSAMTAETREGVKNYLNDEANISYYLENRVYKLREGENFYNPLKDFFNKGTFVEKEFLKLFRLIDEDDFAYDLDVILFDLIQERILDGETLGAMSSVLEAAPASHELHIYDTLQYGIDTFYFNDDERSIYLSLRAEGKQFENEAKEYLSYVNNKIVERAELDVYKNIFHTIINGDIGVDDLDIKAVIEIVKAARDNNRKTVDSYSVPRLLENLPKAKEQKKQDVFEGILEALNNFSSEYFEEKE